MPRGRLSLPTTALSGAVVDEAMKPVELVRQVLLSGDRFVSLTEVAVHYGTSRQLVCIWRKRHAHFPDPIAELRTGPLWLLSQFEGLKFGMAGGYRQGKKRAGILAREHHCPNGGAGDPLGPIELQEN